MNKINLFLFVLLLLLFGCGDTVDYSKLTLTQELPFNQEYEVNNGTFEFWNETNIVPGKYNILIEYRTEGAELQTWFNAYTESVLLYKSDKLTKLSGIYNISDNKLYYGFKLIGTGKLYVKDIKIYSY